MATMLAEPEDDGVDVTLVRWMVSLSPEERFAVLQGFVDSIAALIDDLPTPRFRDAPETLARHGASSSW